MSDLFWLSDAQMMVGLAAKHGEEKTVMIEATYLKAHRTATSMGVKTGGGHSTSASPPDRSATTSGHGPC